MTSTMLYVAGGAFFLVAAVALGFCGGVLWTLRKAEKVAEKPEEVDPWSFVRRAEAIQTQMGKVSRRAERAAKEGDLEALRACERESALLTDRMADIRLEQIAWQEAER